MDDVKRGLFATRAPRRPNQIGLSVVKLISIKENIIEIGDADMLDGTPLLDIKPYVPAFTDPEVFTIGWLEGKISGKTGSRP
jgi:tRNA (adenine37-N6)-methyltransferase